MINEAGAYLKSKSGGMLFMSGVNGLSAEENTQAIAGLRKISDKWWNVEGFNYDGMNATMKVMRWVG